MCPSRNVLSLLILTATMLGSIPLLAQNTDVLVAELKSHDEKLRARAARDLGKAGDPAAIPALTAALSDSSTSVRGEVILALGTYHDPAALNAVVSALQDSDPDLRVLAIRTLSGYYTGVMPSAGFAAFWKGQYRRAKGLFVQDIARVDPGVNADPAVVAGLTAALKDETPRVAREAAKALGTLVARPAVPELVIAAHSTDEDLAREALNALGKIRDYSVGPQLMDLLESYSKDVVRDAAVTLGILRHQEAVSRLQLIHENSSDPKTRAKALEGLAYLGNPVSVPVFTRALWSSNDQLRTYAAEGLGRAADPQNLPEVFKALGVERKAAPKLAMQFALAAMGRMDYLSVIVDELGSRLRANAAQTYLRELTSPPRSPSLIYPYLNHKDAAVRKGLCSVLMFSGDQSSLAELERLSRDPDSGVAAEALRAMRAIRARAEETLPPA